MWVEINPGVDWHKRNNSGVDYHKWNKREEVAEGDTRVGMKEGTMSDRIRVLMTSTTSQHIRHGMALPVEETHEEILHVDTPVLIDVIIEIFHHGNTCVDKHCRSPSSCIRFAIARRLYGKIVV